MMKLDMNEKKLLTSFERGQWKPVKNLSEAKKHYQEAARERFCLIQRLQISI